MLGAPQSGEDPLMMLISFHEPPKPSGDQPERSSFDWRLLISWLLVGLVFGTAIVIKLWKGSF